MWTPVLITCCAAGVVFYIRFAFALCRECWRRSSGYWMLLRTIPQPESVITIPVDEKKIRHAA